jgi:hypothetical protein
MIYPGLLYVLLLLLRSFAYSFMVLSLLNLPLCTMLPTLTYAELSDSSFLGAPFAGGGGFPPLT